MSGKPFHYPGPDTHLIESRYVAQTFKIQVHWPLLKRGEQERFPALYVLEGHGGAAALKEIAFGLQITGQVRRFLLVAIGYPEESPLAGAIRRGRDLAPDHYPNIPGLQRTSQIEGVPGFEDVEKNRRGGKDFLAFIRNELMSLIEEKYPVIPGDRACFGHSLGGTLGLHALFSHPGIFSRYIISSPGLCWNDDDHGIREARSFIASGKGVDARVFMSVAEQEQFEPFLGPSKFVSSFFRLAEMLHRAKIPGLHFTHRLFLDEGHITVWPVAFSHGLRAIYEPADGPVMGTPKWAAADEQSAPD
jgi:predicted alpha/beta superfamily hydrolase